MCIVFLCFSYHKIFPPNVCFSSPSALFICLKIVEPSCIFLMVLSRDLLYPAISITSSFDFFSVHDIYLYSFDAPHFCCFKSSFYAFCQYPAITSMPYEGFLSVDSCVNSDFLLVKMYFISVNASVDTAKLFFISVSHLELL